ncbi:MAG: potassium transporter TrkG [Bacteroidota bacterium]
MNKKDFIEFFISKHEDTITRILRIFIILSSISIVGVMIYKFGFNHSKENLEVLNGITRFFYIVFIINFLVRWILNGRERKFVKQNIFEFLLLLVIVYDGLINLIFGHPFLESFFLARNVVNYRSIYHFFIQFFLLVLVAVEFIKSVNSIYTLRLKPTTLFIFSFVFLILAGGGLLTLPGFNYTGKSLNFIDALFTSASAGCVTGLTVVNTATFFNIKGQLVILFLIQLGGIGILTFASFFASFIKKGLSVRQNIAMNELLDAENISGSYFLIKRILVMTFAIEALGAIGIYILWGDYPFASDGEKIYASIFHSISAFCNAGFSTLEFNFETPLATELYMLHIFIGVIIFFGGLGFPAIRDIFSPLKLRERLREPWKQWKLSTKVALYTSLVLLALGTVAFYYLHVRHLEHIKSPLGKFAASFFQSVNTRTSGYNSINLGELSDTTMLISIFLMFIGASSASTGGGIKTSTFVVMLVAIIGTIKGKTNFSLDRRGIAIDLIYKAFAVVVFSGLFVLTIITLLSLTDPTFSVIKIAYEAVSAFATVGLSTGITAQFSDWGKLILTFSMFVGRVGVITLAYSLSARETDKDFKYAKTHIMIG